MNSNLYNLEQKFNYHISLETGEGTKMLCSINWDVFWNAFSSIATLVAVIAAFVIVKYTDNLGNKKKLDIIWRDGILADGSGANIIMICCINTGNRKIILDQIFILLGSSKQTIVYSDRVFYKLLPCVLEIEETAQFTMPTLIFSSDVEKQLKKETIKHDDIITVLAKDTSGKEYTHKTNRKFTSYLSS